MVESFFEIQIVYVGSLEKRIVIVSVDTIMNSVFMPDCIRMEIQVIFQYQLSRNAHQYY